MTAALYDEDLRESPSRIDPNRVLIRESEIGKDQSREQVLRRQNYERFRKNVEEAFHKADVNGDQKLHLEEFIEFMKAKSAGYGDEKYSEEVVLQLFETMDVKNDNTITVNEFVEAQCREFKNCEDNIEFLGIDIRETEKKIKELQSKLPHIKERESGYTVEGVSIMKGSTLTFNIIDGSFSPDAFPEDAFEPMVMISVMDKETGMEQIQQTTPEDPAQ